MAVAERAAIACAVFTMLCASAAMTADQGAPERPAHGWLRSVDQGLGAALQPGELARVHAQLAGVAACTQCHAGLESAPDARCLECHRDVGERMRAGTGWHATFSGACASCHVEHRGADGDLLGLDRKAFNHDLAAFHLRGGHIGVDCEKCHTRPGSDGTPGFHPIGIAHERCADCHEDVHGTEFQRDRDCAACHTVRGFGSRQLVRADGPDGPAFDHDADTGFALHGRHAAVPCRDCHDAASETRERESHLAPGRGAARDCSSCHRDPHEGALGAKCETCHTPDGFTGKALRFDHARDTRFELDATHAALACASCHRDERFEASSTRCEGCHADAAGLLAGRFRESSGRPDPHQGAVECAACHGSLRAGAALIDYERACVRCHAPEYGSLLVSRKRIVDALVVEVEASQRALELAHARGERGDEAVPAGVAEAVDALARSSAHNPALAEAVLQHLRKQLLPRAEAAR